MTLGTMTCITEEIGDAPGEFHGQSSLIGRRGITPPSVLIKLPPVM
jgi:hypothetical protein